jgi:hypothetical protein
MSGTLEIESTKTVSSSEASFEHSCLKSGAYGTLWIY